MAIIPKLEYFFFKEENLLIQTRLEYVKSNIDGTNIRIVSIYMPHSNQIEVIKIRNGNIDAPFVIATMDNSLFSATKLHAYWVYPKKPRKDQAVLEYFTSAEGSLFKGIRYYSDDRQPQHFETKAIDPPFHLYNFDLTSFNLVLPHLKEDMKTKDFAVNLFDLSPNANGVMECLYLGEEEYNGRPCRKYKVTGPAFNDYPAGYMWVDCELGIMINFEHPVPDNDSWSNFKMEFQCMEKMNYEEWQNWVDNEIQTKLRPMSS